MDNNLGIEIVSNIKEKIFYYMDKVDTDVKSSTLLVKLDINSSLETEISVLISELCEGNIICDTEFNPIIFNFDPLNKTIFFTFNRKDLYNYRKIWIDFTLFNELLSLFSTSYTISVFYEYYNDDEKFIRSKDILISKLKYIKSILLNKE